MNGRKCEGSGQDGACPKKPHLVKPYSEDEPPPKDNQTRFKWRLDPKETFSDWKIEIVSTEKDENQEDLAVVETYHVHKNYLAVGDRKSDYFTRMFQNADKFKESEDCASRIELDPLAASCFPYLLDYIYASERPLEITTETATGLHHLGEYFEIRHLRWDAKQFCQNDLSLDNAEIYYQHATLFQNEAILGVLAAFLGSNIQDVNSSSPLVENSDPQLWLKASKAVDPTNSDHWSEVVSNVGLSQIQTLNSSTFQDLTEASSMPQVHAAVALTLCELEDQIQVASDGQISPGLSSLQERCATALSQTWKDLKTSDEDTLERLNLRKASFLVDLLVKCIDDSKEALKRSEEEVQGWKEKHVKAVGTQQSSVLLFH